MKIQSEKGVYAVRKLQHMLDSYIIEYDEIPPFAEKEFDGIWGIQTKDAFEYWRNHQ